MDASINKKIRSNNRVLSGKWYRNMNNIQLYSMCALPVLWLFIFCYIPMGGIVIAFKDYRFDKGIFGSAWVGIKNFEFFFKSDDFFRITRNTLGLNGIFILTGLVGAVITALMLYEIKRRINVKVYQTMLIVPHFLSWVIVGYMAFAFLNPQYGFINSIIRAMGGEAVDWYSKPGYWPFILTLVSLWKHVGMSSVTYYACLMGINSEYYEAAAIDGANKLQEIWYITLPFLKPLMIILTTLNIGNIFRADFGLFYQLTRNVGALYPTTDVIDTYIYRVMRVVGDMSMSSAASVLQSVVGFVLIMITNAIVNKIEPENALF